MTARASAGVVMAFAAPAVVWVGLAGQAQQPPPPPPDQPTAATQPPQIFRAGVDIVSLNVTVTDHDSHYVTDLSQGDFSVFEDGAKQDVTFFSHGEMPISLSLLIDTSASMEDRMPIAQEAAINFAKRLGPDDRAQVLDFDSRVQVAQDFTNSLPALEKAIRGTAAGGSTSLHNAIYIALKELAKGRAQAEEIRRQAIVVLSDGEDTSSLVSYEEVLDLAKRSETAIYTIGLRPPESGAARGFREAEFVLRQFAQETGGRAFFPERVQDLENVYSQIADELSSQYALGYISHNPRRDGAWRRIVVQVSRPGVTARTKRGYFAPTSH